VRVTVLNNAAVYFGCPAVLVSMPWEFPWPRPIWRKPMKSAFTLSNLRKNITPSMVNSNDLDRHWTSRFHRVIWWLGRRLVWLRQISARAPQFNDRTLPMTITFPAGTDDAIALLIFVGLFLLVFVGGALWVKHGA